MYNPFPIDIDRAKGVHIYDRAGNEYLDTFTGIGVMSFGHSYPPILRRFRDKLKRYAHVSNFFLDEDAPAVADMLVEHTGRDGRVFFTNSGAEASEAAIKAVKKTSVTGGRDRIVYFHEGFHGRTLGALSINGFRRYREPFEPLIPGAVELEFNDVDKFNHFMEHSGDRVIAVFLEPVQGSGGVVPIAARFAEAVEAARKKFGFWLVSDEIQAGLGRTGKFYSYQHFAMNPDIITVGKSLGGGLPLGACVFLDRAASIFAFGDHGSTFAPNPVALAGARYVLEKLPALMPSVVRNSALFAERLRAIASPRVKEIRGLGLMLGVLLDAEDPGLRDAALAKEKLLINVLANRLIRLLPALNATGEELSLMASKLSVLLGDVK